MFKKVLVFSIVMLILSSLFGCENLKVGKEEMPINGKFQVSPSSLFEGDTKKIEPHLGLTSGCVKVKYQGAKKMIKTKYELWRKGIIVEKSDIVSTVINGKFAGELSISLKDEGTDNEKHKYIRTVAITENSGYSSSRGIITNLNIPGSFSPKVLLKPIELSDDKEIAIWGLMAVEGADSLINSDSIEVTAKKVEWAYVSNFFIPDFSSHFKSNWE